MFSKPVILIIVLVLLLVFYFVIRIAQEKPKKLKDPKNLKDIVFGVRILILILALVGIVYGSFFNF